MICDIIVIGGGPAGMTAALYGARAGKQVTLIEAEVCGGQILEARQIENYPALPDVDGYTFSENLRGQIATLGVRIESGRVTALCERNGLFCAYVGEKEYYGRAIVLATGLKHRKLGIVGESELIGRGVSFCATCDGMLFRGREVAVVGGGSTAVQDALLLADVCTRVYLIHRRMELRAERRLVERMSEKKNIEFIGNTVVTAMHGEGRLESLTLQRVDVADERRLAVSAVFEAVGQLPQSEAFGDFVALDKEGYILSNETGSTSHAGVFAAGDGREKAVRQLTTAVSDGTVAALSAVAYLDEETKDREEIRA